ncbi:hypothetical protein B296_00059129 [Ensete ventricosum]|uniref:ATP-dependent Clp protease proteolytic subunit n=1 Tax=Ensete ventricosum TaxID=4639 RepID=A0A426XIY5_ENSVE|nr:hypothetical protein B296_00059129 [Ensete ventricosum]
MAYNVFSRFLKERIVCINGATDRRGDRGAAPLPGVNSPSGAVTAGLAIYDAMQYISSPAKEILKVRDRLNAIYARHTERIQQCMERDTFMSPEEAKEFGLLDEVIVHRPPGRAPPAKHDEPLLHGSLGICKLASGSSNTL